MVIATHAICAITNAQVLYLNEIMLPLNMLSLSTKTKQQQNQNNASKFGLLGQNYDCLQFVIFNYETALKMQPANETPSSNMFKTPSANRAWERQNTDYCFGFINSCNVDAKWVTSCKC